MSKKQEETKAGEAVAEREGSHPAEGNICQWSHYRSLNHVWLFATLRSAACQAPPSMGFSWQECRSGLSFAPAGELPDLGMEAASPVSPALQADSLLLSH